MTMVFHTKEDFLANLKVGDTFWLVGTRTKQVQAPEGPFKILRFCAGKSKIKIDPVYLVESDHFVSDFHHGHKITATTLAEAKTYYDEQVHLEKTDPERQLELAEAILMSRID